MNGKLAIWIVFAVLILIQNSVPIEAAITNLAYVDSGWYRDDQDRNPAGGRHHPDIENYIAGWTSGTYDYSEYRNFFVFDLSDISDPIVMATLRIDAGYYWSSDMTETYSLFDVSTPVSSLRAGGSGLSLIFSDLGTGVSYGFRDITNADSSSVVSIDLNQDAISAMNNMGSLFAIGGAVTTLRYLRGDSEAVFSGSGSGIRELVITTTPAPVPEPGTLMLLGTGLVGMLAMRRKIVRS